MITNSAASAGYHLSRQQIEFFDENGYLVLKGRVSGALLDRLRDAGNAWIALGADSDHPEHEDWMFAERPSGRVMFRVNYLYDKGQPAALELLGSPGILGIAESLAGPNFVPTYESMVFKGAGDGAPIEWHQDAIHPRTHRIFNVDIYLDESRAGAGALRIIPGSQRQPADICALAEQHGWDVPGGLEVELDPGDVLVHDVMLVHGSPPTEGKTLRRTIYYEFRAAEQIAAEGPWDWDFAEAKLRIVPAALAAYARQYPQAQQFEWHPSPQFLPQNLTEENLRLRVVHPLHYGFNSCSAGSVPV